MRQSVIAMLIEEAVPRFIIWLSNRKVNSFAQSLFSVLNAVDSSINAINLRLRQIVKNCYHLLKWSKNRPCYN